MNNNTVFAISSAKHPLIKNMTINDKSILFDTPIFNSAVDVIATAIQTSSLVFAQQDLAFQDISYILGQRNSNVIKIQIKKQDHPLVISMESEAERDRFYAQLVQKGVFKKIEKTSNPMDVIQGPIVGLVVTLFLCIAGMLLSFLVASGEYQEDPDSLQGKSAKRWHMVMTIVNTLGTTGFLLIALAGAAFWSYLIWNRYQRIITEVNLTPVRQ